MHISTFSNPIQKKGAEIEKNLFIDKIALDIEEKDANPINSLNNTKAEAFSQPFTQNLKCNISLANVVVTN